MKSAHLPFGKLNIELSLPDDDILSMGTPIAHENPAGLLSEMIESGIKVLREGSQSPLRIAYLKDGPYGIPL